MTPTELDRLAGAASRLRPDWPQASIRTYLAAAHAERAYRDVAVALAWIACDPATKTPKRLEEAGPWWQSTHDPIASGPATPVPPRTGEMCPVHLGWAGNCPGCRADRLAGLEAEPPSKGWNAA